MAAEQTLQAEIAGDEKAIRHLIGERDALSSTLKRRQALLKLREGRLHALATRGHAAVGHGPTLSHGDRFPDTSSYQPHVDLQAVRTAGALRCGSLAFSKITEGTSWSDPYGARRWREMAGLGFPHRGGYHFIHPSESGRDQADHFLSALHADGVVIRSSDVLCCDCEVSDGEHASLVATCVREFGQVLAKETPAARWLYGGGPFLYECGVPLDGYEAHWLSAYTGDPAPYMIYGRARTVAWQYSDGVYGPSPRVCPGIGAGDMSIIL